MIRKYTLTAVLGWMSAFVVIFCAPQALNTMMLTTGWRWPLGGSSHGALAPLFTHEVAYWSADLVRWGNQYDLDPNLLATVMQIESCGHPTVVSRAGAQGLFQVMPFHFSTGEDMIDPDTNAFRAAKFLEYCYTYSGKDVGLTFACYNGGPSVVNKNMHAWPAETQRYYVWGVGIYADAIQGKDESSTLDRWLSAGGIGLCQMADVTLGLRS
jgi:soluble lytic murein transglycosylase-like protein